MKITVRDREGNKYLLTERHLKEDSRSHQRRVVREDLATALSPEMANRGRISGEVVDGWMWWRRVLRNWECWDVRLHDSNIPSLCELRIGCKVFLGYDASEILAWARERPL